MKIHFKKYQGTGNDFVMIDDRSGDYKELSNEQVKLLCDRKFGIGADGLILLRNAEGYDFEMVYYNSDGRPSSMCGNGGRCLLQFASDLGIEADTYSFIAVDGPHLGKVSSDSVSLQMIDVSEIKEVSNKDYFLDTGSPHHISFKEELPQASFVNEAKEIRHNDHYNKEGVNVNFVERAGEAIRMRTFERGVEDETLSCGTGVTAAAIAFHNSGQTNRNHVEVNTLGGDLSVDFEEKNGNYSNIWLTGAAEFVFNGEISID